MPSSDLNRIAVYTSGGDAPGMNAAVRAVVRSGITQGLKVDGIYDGYEGMLAGDFVELELRSVANIIQRGGTILRSGRCPQFLEKSIRAKAFENLKSRGTDALVCVGGDGSFRGAHLLSEEHGIRVVGVPGTIDNDIFGTDMTIGFDTAVNTALEAIDRIRDTAASHSRLFIVEVMGRNSGFIATHVGLAGGAEEVFVPESPYNLDDVIRHIKRGVDRGKSSSILVAAEGQKPGRAYDLAEALRKSAGYDAKVCILGHIQRGGSPTAGDRVLASRLGAEAVQQLVHGESGFMVGQEAGKIVKVGLSDCFNKNRSANPALVDLIRWLAN